MFGPNTHFSILKSIGLLLFLFLTCIETQGQISKELFAALPDSARPKDRLNITLKEAPDVLASGFKLEKRSPKDVKELDNLARLLGPKYVAIRGNQERIQFLEAICRHIFNSHNLYSGGKVMSRGRSAAYLSSNKELGVALNYSNILIDEITKYAPDNHKLFVTAYSAKAFFLLERDELMQSYRSNRTALDYAKKTKNDLLICQTFNRVASSYEMFGLAEQSIIYSDSAQIFLNKLNKETPVSNANHATIIWNKQRAYLTMLSQDPELKYAADSIKALHKLQIFDNYTKGRRRASSFIMLAGVNFYQKKYQEVITCLDSAEKTFANLPILVMWDDAMIYKGISLLSLGREKEGYELLKGLNFDNVYSTGIPSALQVLISYQKNIGNLSEVTHYQDLLINYNSKKHEREMLGKVLEVEQQYQVAARDYEILRLTERQKRNLWISLFIGLIGIGILAYLWLRYQKNKARTEKLLDQIKEETALELEKVEEANALERKRLGQELHDGLASSIAVAVRYLKGRATQHVTGEEKHDLIAISNTLEESYNITRTQSNRLFQEDNSRQFCKRLEEKTKLFFADTAINFEFSGEISGLAISSDVKTVILMITQEAITNIIKHAKATEASILLYYDRDFLKLEISDNGKGIPQSTVKKGMGLKSMESRVASINGVIGIDSGKASGTVLTVKLPLPADE